MTIHDLRSEIDEIDTKLVDLLNRRTELAQEVGRFKSSYGLALRVPARERAILKRLKKLNTGPLDNESIEEIYRVIFDLSVRSQQVHGMGNTANGKGNRGAARGSQRKPARA
jgi:3-deoxy-7-phosphoheptulonate synthase/chorismate mutase